MTDEDLLERFDIYLTRRGDIRAPSGWARMEDRGFTREDQSFLLQVGGRTPISLSMETGRLPLIRDRVNGGRFAIEAECLRSINNALDQAEGAATPLMAVSDLALVGFVRDGKCLVCVKSRFGFEAGRRYRVASRDYVFVKNFVRRRVYWEEMRGNFVVEHRCTLRGVDRKLVFENGKEYLGHPDDRNLDHIADSRIWEVFERPEIQTIAETHEAAFNQNLNVLSAIEEMGDFEYLPGQLDYISRMGIKDFGYAVGETGVGKTLIAISLITLKGSDRTLIIAPRGTIKGEGHTTSQWVNELRRFAPFLQVFEMFSKGDYCRILELNDGKLPPGVYISYYEAMFLNDTVENVPTDIFGAPKWNDEVLLMKAKCGMRPPSDEVGLAEGVGNSTNGVRCIARPSLATLVGRSFEMICLDEAQHCKNLSSNRTKAFIQLEARFRFAFTATPIPNTVVDLFPIMGWLCVPQWWRGRRANAAWPYRLEDESRFINQFTSKERDFTREEMNRRANPRWRGRAEASSPIISSPARLLRLLQPAVAFIRKIDCALDYVPPVIRDIRVKMGEEQRRLYGYFMDRANIRRPDGQRYRDQRIVAGVQASKLRAVCTDPASIEPVGNVPTVTSNFNPKVIAILELVKDTLARGSQIVIVNSRLGITNDLESRLGECGIQCSRIDSTKAKKATEADRFKKRETQAMLMGLNCAAGYSFDQCDTLIIASIEYTPGSFTQAIGRVDRVTSRGANIYCILCDNTIESMMFDTVAMKDDAAKICLHGERVPRDFTPVDMEEVLADAVTSWGEGGESVPEIDCEKQWPRLREAIRRSANQTSMEIEDET